MFSPGRIQPNFLGAASSSKYSKGLMMMMMMMISMMAVGMVVAVAVAVVMIMMMLMLVLLPLMMMMMMMTTTFQARFEVFLMCSFVCLGFRTFSFIKF